MEIKTMGSIYFDGNAMEPGFDCNGRSIISFGDTVFGKELQWVDIGVELVADRCVCTGISRRDLERLGFVYGQPVKIDGRSYWCRCLRVGTKEGEPCEWKRILDQFGDSDDLWHWRDSFFWGQEISSKGFCATAGCFSAESLGAHEAEGFRSNIGFRPVLTLLPAIPSDFRELMGQPISVYGSTRSPIEGYVTGFTDYDLEVELLELMPKGFDGAVRNGKTVTIRRDSVTWIDS